MSDSSRTVISVFGRRVIAERRGSEWLFFWPGEGKRRPAHELRVDPGLGVDEMLAALGDLCHEWASPEHPDVVVLTGP